MTLNDFSSAMCRENQLLFCEAAQMLADFCTRQELNAGGINEAHKRAILDFFCN